MSVGSIAMEFMGRGGKRLRPRLCAAVYAACGGAEDISPLEDAVECFHKASLIHDDIQDGDEERYGRPTVWKEHGVPLAIAAGDWLVARGYSLIAHCGKGNPAAMLSAAVESHLRLCEGQGDELTGKGRADPSAFDPETYVSVCERKTGEAFALAARLGAKAAGAPADAEERYARYAMSYGTLFQIRDDLADVGTFDALSALEREYEGKTALYRDECALGVW